ncbi:DTW domain containing 2 [Columba livia]|uniref:tRNA-uridine aminocarboxypropyltransferase n=1 Tax=Columba livia TaxID=8932 RepID=A0A2I0M8X3_COLLI|nr:DTW domain containing 2 [Columba livia]
METWWDGSCDWGVGMEGHRLFREGRQGRRGGSVTFYVNDYLECMELCLGMDEELTKSLQVRRTGTGDIIVGVCYRPPNQEDQVDEALYGQMGAASHSQAMVLTGDFSYPNICWRDNTAGYKHSRRFLECVGGSFLLQVIEKPLRRGAVQDLILTNKKGPVGNVKLKGCLVCSDHEMMEFKMLRTVRRVHNKLTALDFRRADFVLFRDLACANLLKFNKAKCKVLHVGQGNAKHRYRLCREWIESSPEEEDLGMLIVEKLNMTWWCALAAQKASHILSYIKRSVVKGELQLLFEPLNAANCTVTSTSPSASRAAFPLAPCHVDYDCIPHDLQKSLCCLTPSLLTLEWLEQRGAKGHGHGAASSGGQMGAAQVIARQIALTCSEIAYSRPQKVCLCPFLPIHPLKVSTCLYIIQHPAEESRVLRTVPLLAACLPPDKCKILVGRRFSEERYPELATVCRNPDTIILYPGADATNLEEFAVTSSGPSVMIIIDGTWSQAKDIFYKNSLFRLPKQVQVKNNISSQYVIRTQPTNTCLSTLECAAVALTIMEKNKSIQETILRPLQALCSFQLQHGAQIHHSKEHLLKNGLYDKPMPKNKRKLRRMELLVNNVKI